MKLHNGYYFGGPGAVGVFFLRLMMGYAFMVHGYSKIQNPMHWGDKFLGGTPGFLQALAALSEFGGGLALILGLLTPLACLGIMSTMFVAWLTNKGHPMVSGNSGVDTYEDVAFYFTGALSILLIGPGRLALDAALFGRRRGVLESREAART